MSTCKWRSESKTEEYLTVVLTQTPVSSLIYSQLYSFLLCLHLGDLVVELKIMNQKRKTVKASFRFDSAYYIVQRYRLTSNNYMNGQSKFQRQIYTRVCNIISCILTTLSVVSQRSTRKQFTVIIWSFSRKDCQ